MKNPHLKYSRRKMRECRELFSPGIWWIGLSLNIGGPEVQHLQMNS